MSILEQFLTKKNLAKLKSLNNIYVEKLIENYVMLCKPAKVTIITDDLEDIAYVRKMALNAGEEQKLRTTGHTIHYDGYYDQGRDRESTAVLLPEGQKISRGIRSMEREAGLREVLSLLDGAMKGKECLVRFFSLGPTNSRFSICALQLTDSFYVGHSEDLLYRSGYEQFMKLNGSENFFSFLHSAGELDERKCSKNVSKRRIYIDFVDGKVYSVNTQYAGNTIGLKKLALRLAIYKANHADWLAEHMFLMGAHPAGKNRITYFTGAYPSACGKTSTVMIPGQSIVGDDISYIKYDEDGNARAVNVEMGIFGIIQDVNSIDDPLIYKALTSPRELVFSNLLVADGVPYWVGMGRNDIPKKGVNHSGEWLEGKKDAEGNEIPLAHSNARYAMRISELDNADPLINDTKGIVVQGIFYGGRDSDTNVPVFEALSWEHGVYIGATVESETTFATLGQQGIRRSDPFANLDFMVVPLGLYITNHLKFGKKLKNHPKIFATNYFLKHNGKYTNEKVDKKIWLLWAEGRVHNEYDVIKTPIGYLPEYADLKKLFKQVFNRDYTEANYNIQFTLRLDKLLEKIIRIKEVFASESGIPVEFWDVLTQQEADIKALKAKAGTSFIQPSFFFS